MADDNQMGKFVKIACQNLQKLEQELIVSGNRKAAEIIASEITRLETIASVHLVDLADIKPSFRKRDPLETALYRLWTEKYPNYGRPSSRDFSAVKNLFKDVINVAYKQTTEVFLERVLENYFKSTAAWVKQNSSLSLFARHFKRFAEGPVHDANWNVPLTQTINNGPSAFMK